MAFMFIFLLTPILLFAALLGLGGYEDRILSAPAPNARGTPAPGPVPVTGWPGIAALTSGSGAAAAQPGTE